MSFKTQPNLTTFATTHACGRVSPFSNGLKFSFKFVVRLLFTVIISVSIIKLAGILTAFMFKALNPSFEFLILIVTVIAGGGVIMEGKTIAAFTYPASNPSRVAHDQGMIRYIFCNYGASAYKGVTAYGVSAYNSGVGADRRSFPHKRHLEFMLP